MSPKPLFFVVRPGLEQITPTGELFSDPGTIVPLIPLDLLPEWVEIVGVPRRLTPEQTNGMHNLGPLHAETGTYRLKFHKGDDTPAAQQHEIDDNTPDLIDSSPPLSRENSPQGAPTAREPATPESISSHFRPKTTTTKGLSSSRHNPDNDIPPFFPPASRLPSNSPPPPPPPPPLRNLGSKRAYKTQSQYCRHWCRRGICKWGTSCRFQHTMPTTAEELADVGLGDIPVWYRAAMGIVRDMGLSPGMLGGVDPRRRLDDRKKQKHKEPVTVKGAARVGSHEDPELGEDADDEKDSTLRNPSEECLIDF